MPTNVSQVWLYCQTSSALLRGVVDRVIRLDVADFTAAMSQPVAKDGSGTLFVPARRAGHANGGRARAIACPRTIRAIDGGRPGPRTECGVITGVAAEHNRIKSAR